MMLQHKIRDCQDWALDLVRYLAGHNFIDAEAIRVVEEQIDPQMGISLRPVTVRDPPSY